MNTEKIKFIREELELTQVKFTEMFGCTYSLWEINKNTIPLIYLNNLSNILNVNIDYLIDLSDEKNITFNKIDIDRKILGERIKQARMSINYTQEKLANKLNTIH